MSRFIESIKFEHGKYHLLELHQERINQTFAAYFPTKTPPNLTDCLPNIESAELTKVRFLYNGDKLELMHEHYSPRPVSSLRVIHSTLNYSFKSENRKELDNLFDQRAGYDDILIVKDGHVTDSYYANVCFWDGSKWITPNTYLLNGVKRTHYLNEGLLMEKSVQIEEVLEFEKACLINAMLDLGEVEIPCADIHT